MDRASGIVVALLAALPACAQEADVDVSAAVTTDDRFRGISQSNRNPAVQATLDLQLPSGLFAGAFASTVNHALLGGADAEIDLYAGYSARRSSGAHYSIGPFGYVYPGGRDVETQTRTGAPFSAAWARRARWHRCR